MWGLAVSLAVRQQEMARHYVNSQPSGVKGGIQNRNLSTQAVDRFESSTRFGNKDQQKKPVQFFATSNKETATKMHFDTFLGAVLQKVHPTLFAFWQRFTNKN